MEQVGRYGKTEGRFASKLMLDIASIYLVDCFFVFLIGRRLLIEPFECVGVEGGELRAGKDDLFESVTDLI